MQEALRGYTRDAAYSVGEDPIKGSLVAGKLADMVILDRDIFSIDPAEIALTKPLATIVGGKVVFGQV